MKKATYNTLAFLLISFTSCSQNNKTVSESGEENSTEKVKQKINTEPHRYGGWYCPDNLNGFPAVDIANWKNVPVVNDRMPTKEETQNGTSLIFIDMDKYPNSKPLNLAMPMLAKIYNQSTRRNEIIILIQGVKIGHDSIVGFRYLNGGNGSARLKEVTILSEDEISKIPNSKFVTLKIEIDANENVIWDVLKNPKYANDFQFLFDKENELKKEWRKYTNFNYQYANSGKSTASFSDRHYGAYYIQNDYNNLNYSDKLFLALNQKNNKYQLNISCGPFTEDYEEQKEILINWSNEVKRISEEKK